MHHNRLQNAMTGSNQLNNHDYQVLITILTYLLNSVVLLCKADEPCVLDSLAHFIFNIFYSARKRNARGTLRITLVFSTFASD